jgi:hypothetical protein
VETKKCATCKQSLPVESFEFKDKSKGRRSSWCKECTKEYKKKHYCDKKQKHIASATLSNYRRRQERRQAVWDYLSSHPCVDCGESDQVVLEFDHVNPSEKLCSIAKMIADTKPLEAIFQEIKKCEVRCANCHRRKTAKQMMWHEDPEDVVRVPTRKYRSSRKELADDSP